MKFTTGSGAPTSVPTEVGEIYKDTDANIKYIANGIASSGDWEELGAVDLLADVVTNSKIADGAVSLEHLDSGIAPSHIVKFAGSFNTVGGDANESITVTGATATDIAIVVLHTKGATPRTILTAQAATNAINVEMSGDPSNDHVLKYMVLRAAS